MIIRNIKNEEKFGRKNINKVIINSMKYRIYSVEVNDFYSTYPLLHKKIKFSSITRMYLKQVEKYPLNG